MKASTIKADEHIRAALEAADPATGSVVANLGNPFGDPPEPMVIPVHVRDIRTRVINPRGSANVRRQEISDSLREAGFTQVIDITRRPGDEFYITAAGGDTRVEEAQCLCEESGEARFCEPMFRFVPWVNASTVMGNALAENLVRGDMGWWETASAVMRQKALLEEDLGTPLSIRKLAERLSAQGIPVGKSAASLYQFATSHLAALSDAAKAALTKEAATALQPLFNAVVRLQQLSPLPHDLLQSALAEHAIGDDGDFGHRRLMKAITGAIAEHLDQPAATVGAAIDHLKGGGKADSLETLISAAEELSAARTPARRPTRRTEPSPAPNESAAPPITGGLEQHRSIAVELVQPIAELYELPVVPIALGYGFTLDLPDPPLESHDIHRVSAFWLLLLTSESTASQHRVEYCASAGSTLMRQIAVGSVDGVIEPIWAQLGYTTLLDAAFSPFDQLFELLAHCRNMRAAFPGLWELPG